MKISVISCLDKRQHSLRTALVIDSILLGNYLYQQHTFTYLNVRGCALICHSNPLISSNVIILVLVRIRSSQTEHCHSLYLCQSTGRSGKHSTGLSCCRTHHLGYTTHIQVLWIELDSRTSRHA